MVDTFATVAIAVSAVATSLLISELSRRYGGRERIMEIQKFVNEINKQYYAAGRAKDERKIAELEMKMKDFPKLMGESIVLQMKNLLIIIVIFLAATWLVKLVFPVFTIDLPFQLPVPRFQENMLFEMKSTFGAYGWFILSLAVFGSAASFIMSKIQRKTNQ